MKEIILDQSVLKKAPLSLIARNFSELYQGESILLIIDKSTLNKLHQEHVAKRKKDKNPVIASLFEDIGDLMEQSGGHKKIENGGVSYEKKACNGKIKISIKSFPKDDASSKSVYSSINLQISLKKEGVLIYTADTMLYYEASEKKISCLRLKDYDINKGFFLENELSEEDCLLINEGKVPSSITENSYISFGSKNYIARAGKLVPIDLNLFSSRKVKGKNLEQKLSMHSLRDDEIKIVFLTGRAGVGKTFLALNEFYLGYKEENRRYEKLIITSSNVSAEDNGSVPGNEKEKIFGSINQIETVLLDLKKIYQDSFFDKLIEDLKADQGKEPNEILFVEPLNSQRGKTYHNAMIIYEEAQNSEPAHIKLTLERAGENVKFVITGDLSQVLAKNSTITKYYNGLLHAEKAFRGSSIASVIYSTKAETRGVIPAEVVKRFRI